MGAALTRPVCMEPGLATIETSLGMFAAANSDGKGDLPVALCRVEATSLSPCRSRPQCAVTTSPVRGRERSRFKVLGFKARRSFQGILSLRACALWLTALLGFLAGPLPAAETAGGVSTVQLEALKRLQGVDLEANPALKAAVLKLVQATRGTPQFVDLVEQFKLAGQNEGLREVALKFPADEAGVKAIRMILDSGDPSLIAAALKSGDQAALPCVRVLGNTRLPGVNELVLPLLAAEASSDALRREVVKALAKNEAGARQLLTLAGDGRLVDEVKLTAAMALSQVGSPELRAEASRILPLPKAGGDEALPPISELAQRAGNPTNGELIYFNDTTACHRCHQVNGKGVALGPDLSQIGDKLGKDALLEAILDPNNGVAFGFEAWTVTTKGDEELYGLVVSETTDELAVKDLSGVVHRVKKTDVASRTQSTFSLMPSGLQATMKVQELVDLVEYLSRLRKPVP